MNYISLIVVLLGFCLFVIAVFDFFNPKKEILVGEYVEFINRKEKPFRYYLFITIEFLVAILMVIWGIIAFLY